MTAEALAAAYRLVCLLPLGCGVLQLAAWRFFDLHGEKLQKLPRPWDEERAEKPPRRQCGARERAPAEAEMEAPAAAVAGPPQTAAQSDESSSRHTDTYQTPRRPPPIRIPPA